MRGWFPAGSGVCRILVLLPSVFDRSQHGVVNSKCSSLFSTADDIFFTLCSSRSIALLDYDGNLVTMEMTSGELKRVAEGVESVVDLSVS